METSTTILVVILGILGTIAIVAINYKLDKDSKALDAKASELIKIQEELAFAKVLGIQYKEAKKANNQDRMEELWLSRIDQINKIEQMYAAYKAKWGE